MTTSAQLTHKSAIKGLFGYLRGASRLYRLSSPTDEVGHDDTDSDASEDDDDSEAGCSPNSFRADATSGAIGTAGPLEAVAVEPGQRAGGGAACGGGSSRGVGPRGQQSFVLVAKEHLVGTWLAVFVKEALLPGVSDVRTGE